jgi:hypothetical protein
MCVHTQYQHTHIFKIKKCALVRVEGEGGALEVGIAQRARHHEGACVLWFVCVVSCILCCVVLEMGGLLHIIYIYI